MNLRPAIKVALRRAEPPALTCTLRTRGNVVERVVGGKVVGKPWKRRPSETVQEAFNRVMTMLVNEGQIRSVIASSSDDLELGEEELKQS